MGIIYLVARQHPYSEPTICALPSSNRQATGLPKYTNLHKLLLVDCLPPLECYLNFLSMKQDIRLLFTGRSSPLHYKVAPANNIGSLQWLLTLCNELHTIPDLYYSLHLLKKFLKERNRFEDTFTPATSPFYIVIIPFVITPFTTNAQIPKQHNPQLKLAGSGNDNIYLLYSDSSRSQNSTFDAAWTIYKDSTTP